MDDIGDDSSDDSSVEDDKYSSSRVGETNVLSVISNDQNHSTQAQYHHIDGEESVVSAHTSETYDTW